MKSRFTIRRMTSRGVKCSPAVSLESSANLRISSSNTSAHLRVAHHLGVQVDVRELLGDQVEQPGLGEPVDLRVELEALEDVAHRGRERLDVGAQVLADVVLVAHQLLQVERRRVVEELARTCEQERLGVEPGLGRARLLGQHGGLGRLEHAVEAAQHGERQDDLAVLGLLVVAAEEVGDGPDEGGEVGRTRLPPSGQPRVEGPGRTVHHAALARARGRADRRASIPAVAVTPRVDTLVAPRSSFVLGGGFNTNSRN
jgi:hypothetical protein